MSRLLLEVIATRAKNISLELHKEVTVIKEKIKEKPQNIEKLTEIMEFMNIVPNDLEKIKQEIEKSMSIYSIMDEFNYCFQEEDIRRKWQVFGGPKDVIKLIEDQK